MSEDVKDKATPKSKRPRVPKSVRIGPHDYKVVHVVGLKDDEGNRLNGQLDDDSTTLKLDRHLRHSKKQEISLHESLHGCFYGSDFDRDMEEKMVTYLSPRLLELIQNNPELIEYLRHKE